MSPQNKATQCSPLMANYSRYNVEFGMGEGAYLYDSAGKVYLDFLSGIAVTGFGHNHHLLMKALQNAIAQPWHVSNLFTISGQERLAEQLTNASGLDSAFFCNSGTEANEAAIKFARKWGGGRTKIIVAKESFHGRTMGSLSATGQEKFWEGFGPMLSGFAFVPFGDSAALTDAIDDDTVAIMLEPIQGESGIIVPPDDYLPKVKALCEQHHLLLILDEVQAGMGRTGKMFAHQWYDLTPDIITVAKGIANGLPLGATICGSKVAELITPGTHGSTFGGNPIAVAVAEQVMQLLQPELLTAIANMGNTLKNAIISLEHPAIREVRGKGLMLGIVLQSEYEAKKVAQSALEDGLILGTSGNNVLRLLPPFIIAEKQISEFISLFSGVLHKLL